MGVDCDPKYDQNISANALGEGRVKCPAQKCPSIYGHTVIARHVSEDTFKRVPRHPPQHIPAHSLNPSATSSCRGRQRGCSCSRSFAPAISGRPPSSSPTSVAAASPTRASHGQCPACSFDPGAWFDRTDTHHDQRVDIPRRGPRRRLMSTPVTVTVTVRASNPAATRPGAAAPSEAAHGHTVTVTAALSDCHGHLTSGRGSAARPP